MKKRFMFRGLNSVSIYLASAPFRRRTCHASVSRSWARPFWRPPCPRTRSRYSQDNWPYAGYPQSVCNPDPACTIHRLHSRSWPARKWCGARSSRVSCKDFPENCQSNKGVLAINGLSISRRISLITRPLWFSAQRIKL